MEDVVEERYRGPPVGDNVTILHQITSGLRYLHKKNIIHRDIKPVNILVTCTDDATKRPPKMKLADFGICRIVNEQYLNKTQLSLSKGSNSEVIKRGTPGWMAPEICHGDGFHFSADVFSLGCVFSYTLISKHPFGDNKEMRADLIYYKKDMILTLEQFMEHNYDDKMFELIKSMVHSDADKRPNIDQVYKQTNNYNKHNNF